MSSGVLCNFMYALLAKSAVWSFISKDAGSTASIFWISAESAFKTREKDDVYITLNANSLLGLSYLCITSVVKDITSLFQLSYSMTKAGIGLLVQASKILAYIPKFYLHLPPQYYWKVLCMIQYYAISPFERRERLRIIWFIQKFCISLFQRIPQFLHLLWKKDVDNESQR